MKYALLVRPEARAEIDDAAIYYQGKSLGLGVRFIRYVDDALANASERPLSFPVYVGTIRRVKTKTFPYAAYFSLEDDAVVILAIVHQHRSPAFVLRVLRQRT